MLNNALEFNRRKWSIPSNNQEGKFPFNITIKRNSRIQEANATNDFFGINSLAAFLFIEEKDRLRWGRWYIHFLGSFIKNEQAAHESVPNTCGRSLSIMIASCGPYTYCPGRVQNSFCRSYPRHNWLLPVTDWASLLSSTMITANSWEYSLSLSTFEWRYVSNHSPETRLVPKSVEHDNAVACPPGHSKSISLLPLTTQLGPHQSTDHVFEPIRFLQSVVALSHILGSQSQLQPHPWRVSISSHEKRDVLWSSAVTVVYRRLVQFSPTLGRVHNIEGRAWSLADQAVIFVSLGVF